MTAKRTIWMCSLVFLFMTIGVASALVMTSDTGNWPADWPKELEPLRASARTIEVAAGNQENIYEIRFSDRGVFEKVWPMLVALKTPGAPLTLTLCKPPGNASKSAESIISNAEPSVRIYAPAITARTGGVAHAESPWPRELIGPKGELPEYVQDVGTDPAHHWVDVEKLANKESGFHYRARIELELVVDGKVIDLNRIAIPGSTPVIDHRF